jgi:microcystin-dependent protein
MKSHQMLAAALLALFVAGVQAQVNPYIGEIRMFAGDYAPAGWALCDGQLLPVNENQTLYAILGTAYGGDGRTTFALPDLRGRAPIHQGQGPGLTNRRVGREGGVETVTLSVAELPAHSHTASVAADSTVGTTDKPNDKVPARNASSTPAYGDSTNTKLAASAVSISAAGSGQAHENMPPFTVVNFIIALTGTFPSRN